MGRLGRIAPYIVFVLVFFVLPLVGVAKEIITVKQAAFPIVLGLLLGFLAARR